jgi:hypothetical protein
VKFKSKVFSSKGFLFTISIIFFASTLLIFAQTYSNENIEREVRILNSFNSSLPPFVVDDLSFDLERLLDTSISFDYGTSSIIVTINDSIPKQSDLQQKITDYQSFLNDDYFSKIKGSQTINLADINDTGINVSLGTYFDFNHDYSLDIVDFTTVSQILTNIDLNLDFGGDLNNYIWTASAGSVPITVSYIDDSNYFSISDSISNSAQSTLKLIYQDENILLEFGNTSQNNSFKIDSNNSNILDYDIALTYTFDGNFLRAETGATINYNANEIDSNSNLRIS